MKKHIKSMLALTIVFSLALNGCSFNKNTGNENNPNSADSSTESVTDSASDSSSEASTESSEEIKVYEDLAEPEWESVSDNSANEPSTGSSSEEQSSGNDENESQNLKHLTMVFFGDSQIANGQNSGEDIPTLVSQRVPNSTSINLAIGGTTATLEQTTDNAQDYENWSSKSFYGMVLALEGTVDRNKLLAEQPTTLENMNKINPAEVDYYFIEYGANDFFVKAPLDKYSCPEGTLEIQTYYGALARGIDKLKALSPNATIVLMTPFYGIYKSSSGEYLGDSYIVSNGIDTLAGYAKKIKNVAEDYNLYILDGMFREKCDLYLDTQDQYLMDNIHLTLKGRQIFARLLAHVPNVNEGYEPSAYRQTESIKIAEFNPDEYYKLSDDIFQQDFPEEYEKYMKGEYLLAKPDNN